MAAKVAYRSGQHRILPSRQQDGVLQKLESLLWGVVSKPGSGTDMEIEKFLAERRLIRADERAHHQREVFAILRLIVRKIRIRAVRRIQPSQLCAHGPKATNAAPLAGRRWQASRTSHGLHPPLFVKPDEPLFIFGDEEAARLGVEFWDVKDEPYPGYDAEGRPFLLEGKDEKRRLLGLIPFTQADVVLTALEGGPRPNELQRLLREALLNVEAISPSDVDSLSLAELQEAAITRFGIDGAP